MLQFLYEKGIRTPLTSVTMILLDLFFFVIFLLKNFSLSYLSSKRMEKRSAYDKGCKRSTASPYIKNVKTIQAWTGLFENQVLLPECSSLNPLYGLKERHYFPVCLCRLLEEHWTKTHSIHLTVSKWG